MPNMKLLKLIFLLLVFTLVKGYGQENDCATELHLGVTLQQAQSGDLSLYKRSSFTPPLRLAIHIVKYSDGSGGISETELNAKISALNFYFEQAMFQFLYLKLMKFKIVTMRLSRILSI